MRKKSFPLGVLALAMTLLSAPAIAQDPAPVPVFKLTAPQSLTAGDLATISVDPSSNVQDVQFNCVPTPINPNNFRAFSDFAELVCGADAPDGGAFTIVAAANLNGKTLTATTTITFVKPGPPPTPPGPTPPPTPPAPIASHLWLIAVYDTANPPPAVAKLLSNSAFWYGLGKQGHQFKFFDAGAAGAKPYVDAAAKLGKASPCVLFMDADGGKVLSAVALPADETALTAEIDALTGVHQEARRADQRERSVR